MIPPEEVEQPVREEHRDLVENGGIRSHAIRIRTGAPRQGLFAGGGNAHNDVAEEVTGERAELALVHREREHVGWTILSPIDFVQLMNSFVVG